MKRILLMQSSSPIRDLIEIYVTGQPKTEIIILESISESQAYISTNPDLDLMFIGDQLVLDSEVSVFVGILNDYLKGKPVKVVGTNKGLSKVSWVHFIPPATPSHKIVEVFEETLFKGEKEESSDYIKVPFYCFRYLKNAPCNLYLAINQGESNTYVKRVVANDSVDTELLDAYQKKNVTHFCISKQDQNLFMSTIKDHILDAASNDIFNADKVEVMKDAFDYATYIMSDLGFKTEGQEIISALLTSVTSSISTLPEKNKMLIENALKAQNHFFFKHVSLTAIIAGAMFTETGWLLDRGMENLTYAAFFHNLKLNQDDEAKVLDEAAMYLSPSCAKIKNHAKLAAEMVQSIDLISTEVMVLIQEHHGSRDGIGFSEFKHNSSKLSELFMVANEFAVILLLEYENSNDLDLSKLLRDQIKRYGDSGKKILETLQNALTDFTIHGKAQ
jgi:hypothetical protein